MEQDNILSAVALARLLGVPDTTSDQELIDRYKAAYQSAMDTLNSEPVQTAKAEFMRSPHHR